MDAKPKQERQKKPKQTWESQAFKNGYSQALIESDTTGSLKKYWDWWKAYYVKFGEAPTQDLVDRKMDETDWYKERTSSQEKAALQRVQFPEDYKAAVEILKTGIRDTFDNLGIEYTDTDLNEIANEAKLNGWTNDQIKQNVVPKIEQQISAGKNLRGEAGNFQTDLMRWAKTNGIALTNEAAAAFISRGATGAQSLEDAKQELRDTYLVGAYPAWADKIKEGYDPSVLAAPYKTTAENLLELGENQLGMNDQLMQKAMQGVGADGKPAVVPIWEFEKQVRADPRWQKTDNAYKTYTDVGTDILRMFGFR